MCAFTRTSVTYDFFPLNIHMDFSKRPKNLMFQENKYTHTHTHTQINESQKSITAWERDYASEILN